MLDLLLIYLTQLNNDSTVCLATLFILFSTAVFLLLKPLGLPPGPRWRTPLLGNILRFAGRTDMRIALQDLRRQYGEVYSLYLGRRLVVVINGIDALREMFETQAEDIFIRPVLFTEPMLTHGHGLVHVSHQRWKDDHAICMEALRANQNRFDAILQRETSALVGEFKSLGSGPFDPYNTILSSTSKVVSSLIISSEFKATDGDFRTILDMTTRACDLGGDSMLTFFLPFMKYVPGCFCRRDELQQVNTQLEELLDKYIKKRDQDSSGLLEGFATKGNNISDKKLITIARCLLYSGSVAPALTITNVVANLVQHPAMQDRMFQEIKDVLAGDKQATNEDYKALVFTKAFVMETMRLSNLTLVGFLGVTEAKVTFKGHMIPEGTVILPDLDSAMMDPTVWKDPNLFDPDRFIEDAQVEKRGSFIPFFLGYRKCPGQHLAMLETVRLVSGLVRKFKLIPAEEPEVITSPTESKHLYERREFFITVEERQ